MDRQRVGPVMTKTKNAFFIVLVSTLLLLACSAVDVRMGMGTGEGVKLSYRVVGRGEPLVVIHDGPGYEKSIMYPGFDDLASDMAVIYYDQRGCGRSQPLTPLTSLTIDDNVEDLEALREYLHLDRFSVAAHGWGAVIAIEYARKYGEHLNAIILITPISPFKPDPLSRDVLEKLSGRAKLEIAELLNHPGMTMLERRERIMRLMLEGLFYNQKARSKVNLHLVKLSPDVNLRLGRELSEFDLFPVLGQIDVPCLVVIGRHDLLTSVRDQMAYADGIDRSSAVVFNESGHFPFLEEHDVFISVIKEFVLRKRIPTLVDLATGGIGAIF